MQPAALRRDAARRRRTMNTSTSRSSIRQIALYAIAGIGLAVWAFPVIWGLLTSFKTERDVLAYPPKFIFEPTLANYREVIFGASSIVPNLWSSFVVATARDAADDAVRGAGRLCAGAAALSGQARVGLLRAGDADAAAGRPDHSRTTWCCRRSAGSTRYSGLTAIYLTFSLPFAIWLMVSYFEDVPLRDGRGGAARPRRAAARALARDPAAGARRHRGDDDLRLPQRLERVHVRGRAGRQPRPAGDGRDVQLHFGRADAVGEGSPPARCWRWRR